MKNQIGLSQELIKFQIDVSCQYNEIPPELSVYISQQCKFDQTITQPAQVIKFDHLLHFGQTYHLTLVRSGKSDVDPTQMLIIDRVIIDGINVQNLIWNHSYYEPQYPEIWYQQQVSQGQPPELRVPGETWLGHNGTWNLPFGSPFWRHQIEVMS